MGLYVLILLYRHARPRHEVITFIDNVVCYNDDPLPHTPSGPSPGQDSDYAADRRLDVPRC